MLGSICSEVCLNIYYHQHILLKERGREGGREREKEREKGRERERKGGRERKKGERERKGRELGGKREQIECVVTKETSRMSTHTHTHRETELLLLTVRMKHFGYESDSGGFVGIFFREFDR